MINAVDMAVAPARIIASTLVWLRFIRSYLLEFSYVFAAFVDECIPVDGLLLSSFPCMSGPFLPEACRALPRMVFLSHMFLYEKTPFFKHGRFSRVFPGRLRSVTPGTGLEIYDAYVSNLLVRRRFPMGPTTPLLQNILSYICMAFNWRL